MDKIELKNELAFIVTKLVAANRSVQKLGKYHLPTLLLNDVVKFFEDELHNLRMELKK